MDSEAGLDLDRRVWDRDAVLDVLGVVDAEVREVRLEREARDEPDARVDFVEDADASMVQGWDIQSSPFFSRLESRKSHPHVTYQCDEEQEDQRARQELVHGT